MGSADQRVVQRRRRQARARRATRIVAAIVIIAAPFAIWLIDYPINLLVGLPLVVAAIWLALIRFA